MKQKEIPQHAKLILLIRQNITEWKSLRALVSSTSPISFAYTCVSNHPQRQSPVF
jgi:hypothetical protein